MAGAVEGDVFIGRKAQELRGLLKIKYPIEHGIVQDWDDMERIWQYIYSDELKTLSEEVRDIFFIFQFNSQFLSLLYKVAGSLGRGRARLFGSLTKFENNECDRRQG